MGEKTGDENKTTFFFFFVARHKNLIASVAFAIAAIAAVVFAGFRLLEEKRDDKAKRSEDNMTVQKPHRAPDTRAGISSWQTYRSEEFGFEAKYPTDDWIIDITDSGFTLGQATSLDAGGDTDSTILFRVYGNIEPAQFVNETFGASVESGDTVRNRVLLDTIQAQEVRIAAGGRTQPAFSVRFAHNSYGYSIGVSQGTNAEEAILTANQTLSTFRFIQIPNRHVKIDLTLSSLSGPKGKIDLLWDVSVPGEQIGASKNPKRSWPYGYVGAVAEPLGLIEEFTITNTLTESVFLNGIHNEQTRFLSLPSREGKAASKATPIMLLPDRFIASGGMNMKCKDRNIETFLAFLNWVEHVLTRDGKAMEGREINNVCDFELPIEIRPGATFAVKPELYALDFGLTGAVVTGAFGGSHKNFVKADIADIGGEVWLIPEKYKEYDEVARRNTFNIGGFIAADIKDEIGLNQIFRLSDGNGEAVGVRVANAEGGTLIMPYSIPDEKFMPLHGVFDENILGMQIFWYMNDFLPAKNITGRYDSATKEMLKEFQKKANLAYTEEFDEATIFVIKAFKTNRRFYENYADEHIMVSLDAPGSNFRLFSIGTNQVYLYPAEAPGALMATKLAKKPDSIEVAQYMHLTNGSYRFTLGGISILNNTMQDVECSIFSPDNSSVKNFSLAPNEIHRDSGFLKSISTPAMHTLKCGDKFMGLEMRPEQQSRG